MLFLITGTLKINGETLNKRDALVVYDTKSITFETTAKSRLLIMDVPIK